MSAAFKVGDRVTWGGAASPHINEHIGEVVVVVPAGVRCFDARSAAGVHGHMPGTSTIPRGHVSYVVRAESRLYWPRVSQLRPVVDVVAEGQIAIAFTLAKQFVRFETLRDAERAVVVLAAEVERLRALLAARSP